MKSMQGCFNALIVVLFTLLAISSYHRFMVTGTVGALGVLAVNTLMLGLFLGRRPAQSETRAPRLWVLSFAGTALPLLMRPSDYSGLTQVGGTLQVAGLILLASALLSLRRSFSVAPANRGVRVGGLYRIVRHPVYAAELIVFLGVVLANPTVANAAIWLGECALQLLRARAEEQLLEMDPTYRAYLERVGYRLVPGLI